VSNPPYVPDGARGAREVADHDPPLALWGGPDGLDVVRGLLRTAARLLRPGGALGIEHADQQGDALPALVRGTGDFTDVADHPDLAGRPRFTTALRAGETDRPWPSLRPRRPTTAPTPSSAPPASPPPPRRSPAGSSSCCPPTPCTASAPTPSPRRRSRGLLAAKNRGRAMPVPVLIGEASTLAGLTVRVPRTATRLAEAFWPGGLTLVVEHAPSLAWDLGDAAGTVAVRLPDDDVARDLLRRTGPLAVSSANRSGRPAATTAQEAAAQLGEHAAVVLDGGPRAGSAAARSSTAPAPSRGCCASGRCPSSGSARSRPRPSTSGGGLCGSGPARTPPRAGDTVGRPPCRLAPRSTVAMSPPPRARPGDPRGPGRD
jgi:hypothetical protein